MQVEQTARSIKIHLDHYIKEVFAGYAEYIKKAIRPKKVPIAPNIILRPQDTPDIPDRREQKFCRSFVVSVRRHMGQIRYRLHGVTAGSVLRIGWIFALGSTSPPHGILGRHPQL
jgi:hypothetical protein